MSDHDLLRQYARDGSNAAFAEVVGRHLDLVYSAARRQVRSPHLAEDVAQSVFTDLARHANDLDARTPLVAWLHVVTRRTAIDAVRREARRAQREHHAAALMRNDSPSDAWPAVEPLLDEAVESLGAADRTAVLLRFFENKSLREVGAALGTNDDAAQKRVSRAVEQLRAFLVRRGVTVTAAGLASDLSAHALQTAPSGLGATIASATALTKITATAAVETTRILAMTSLQKTFAIAAVVLVAGAGVYETNLLARQSAEAADLRQQIERLEHEGRDLHLAEASTSAKLIAVEQRLDARLATTLPVTPADAALETQMQEWLGQLDRIRDFLAQRPQWNIPELKLLDDESWFGAAATNRFETEEQFRRATARLRDIAVSRASSRISDALKAYVSAHDGLLPTSPLDLAPHFDPPIDADILARYQMMQTGKASDVPRAEQMHLIEPKAPADVEYDAYSYIGLNGHGNSGAAIYADLRDAQRKFSQANGGQRATNAEQLLPLLKWPVSAATLEKYLNPPPAGRNP